MEKGEIWIVNLPPTDFGREQAGGRPGIFLADAEIIGIVVPLTSNLLTLRFPFTLSIKPSSLNGLQEESVALIFQIRALDKRRFLKRIGKLESNALKSIDETIIKMLQLK